MGLKFNKIQTGETDFSDESLTESHEKKYHWL